MLKVIAGSGLVLAAVAGLGAWRALEWIDSGRNITAAIEIDFPKGSNVRQLATTLTQSGLIDAPYFFELYTRHVRDPRKLQAGHYRFVGQVSPRSIVDTITRGDIYEPVVLTFTIPEGFTGKQIIARLSAQGLGSPDEVRQAWTDSQLLRELRIPAKNFEGFFYPATYSFTKMPSLKEVIRAGVEQFWKSLPPEYETKLREKKLSLLQAVIFASLIEVETRIDDERPKVSEVIWRRLRAGEPLGIDAALIYGIVDYDGDIKWVHLKDKKNLYNTRIHKGLPPTPIASPARKSLEAVLNPTDAGYYYYVLDADNKERHVFTKTHREHQQHVERLINQGR